MGTTRSELTPPAAERCAAPNAPILPSRRLTGWACQSQTIPSPVSWSVHRRSAGTVVFSPQLLWSGMLCHTGLRPLKWGQGSRGTRVVSAHGDAVPPVHSSARDGRAGERCWVRTEPRRNGCPSSVRAPDLGPGLCTACPRFAAHPLSLQPLPPRRASSNAEANGGRPVRILTPPPPSRPPNGLMAESVYGGDIQSISTDH